MRINDVKTDPRGIVMIIERKGLLTHSWNIQGVFILDSFGNVYRAYHNMILDMYELFDDGHSILDRFINYKLIYSTYIILIKRRTIPVAFLKMM